MQIGGYQDVGDFGEENTAIHEYDCPELPPLDNLKRAMSRRTVSNGMNYLLPVDQGKNSVENHYRTDLRAMFQEPYTQFKSKQYNELQVTGTSKIHFKVNSNVNRIFKPVDTGIPRINSDSERILAYYNTLTPKTGNHMSNARHNKARSDLFLPAGGKTKVPEEVVKLRAEVERMLKSVQEDTGGYDADTDNKDVRFQRISRGKTSDDILNEKLSRMEMDDDISPRDHKEYVLHDGSYIKTAGHVDSYEQIRNKTPPTVVIPDALVSPFLSDTKNQDIWEWLNGEEPRTEFNYFLSVCG